MYVVGGWPSQHAHQKEFNGSKEQAGLLRLIGDMMGIEWMEYFGMERRDLDGDLEKECVVALILDCGIAGDGKGMVEKGV